MCVQPLATKHHVKFWHVMHFLVYEVQKTVKFPVNYSSYNV